MVNTTDDWDVDLTPRQIEKLSPAKKRLRSRASLERKVDIVEKWSRDRSSARKHEHLIPWKRPALRDWNDPSKRLWSWKFTPVDSPEGDNSDLMKRLSGALDLLRKLLDGPDSELEALRRRVATLEKQNLELLSEISQLQMKIPRPVSRR